MGKGWLKERCGLEPRTNFFPFKKSPKTECGLDSGADQIREYTVADSDDTNIHTYMSEKPLSGKTDVLQKHHYHYMLFL